MMGRKSKSVLLGALLAVVGVACTGEPGPAGPAGEQGTQGDPGKDAVPPAPIKGDPGVNAQPRLLDEKLPGWKPNVRTALNDLLTKYGNTSAGYSAMNRPVAVFDWDNTVLKNDIGDATFFWMIQNSKILQPDGKDWGKTSPNLTADAKAALNAACDALASEKQPLPTGDVTNAAGQACAKEIVKIYDSGKTAAGLAAWSPSTTNYINSPYAWVAQLCKGYTPTEVRSFAKQAFDINSNNPYGPTSADQSTQTIGGVAGYNYYVRIYEQIADLMGALEHDGFDVWVVTASPQLFVDAISDYVGVQPDHVVGIRNVIKDGVLTYDLEAMCAQAKNTIITFDQGKRCVINKYIFRVDDASALQRQTDLKKRPVLVAGDSDTDIAMLKDATALKLVINRQKTQLMCNAYANCTGNWYVNPMFIYPKTTARDYPCATAKGNAGEALVDECGNAIPNQDGKDVVP